MSLPPHRVDYSPIIDRPKITWPNKARVAFWVAPNVEHYEYLPDYDGQRNPWPRTPYPDVREYSYRDYGNRGGLLAHDRGAGCLPDQMLCVAQPGCPGALIRKLARP